MKVSPEFFGYVNAAATALFIICLPLPYWMNIDGWKNVGPFQQESHGSSKFYETHCVDQMSQTECGYLFALQISAVLSVLFGFFSTLIYFIPPRTIDAVPMFLASCGTVAQLVMAIMTLVIFAYFQKGYFDDDGINQEYPQPDTASLSIIFWVWMAGTLALGISTVTGYYAIRASTQYKRGMLNIE